MLNPDEPTVRWATFGRQVEQFWSSDIGQFIAARAEKQIEEAMRDLVCADPHNFVRIQQLQNDVKVPQLIKEWLAEAVAAGHAALEELRNA